LSPYDELIQHLSSSRPLPIIFSVVIVVLISSQLYLMSVSDEKFRTFLTKRVITILNLVCIFFLFAFFFVEAEINDNKTESLFKDYVENLEREEFYIKDIGSIQNIKNRGFDADRIIIKANVFDESGSLIFREQEIETKLSCSDIETDGVLRGKLFQKEKVAEGLREIGGSASNKDHIKVPSGILEAELEINRESELCQGIYLEQ